MDASSADRVEVGEAVGIALPEVEALPSAGWFHGSTRAVTRAGCLVLCGYLAAAVGPQASLTLMLTLGYAGSAAAMYWLLRRHGVSVLAGALGGAVYGFSPALLDSGVSHYNLQFAVLPPLVVEAVLRLFGGKGRPVAVGAWLGALVAAQLFIEEEVLADVVIVCLLLLAVVLVASRRRAVLPRLRAVTAGFGTAVVAVLAICGYGLWIQFHGPLTEHGSPFLNSKTVNSAGAFVNPQAGLLFHTASSAAYATSHGLIGSEYLAYLGWPMLVLLVLVIIWYWRDLRVRAAGVVWAVLELLSLGGGSVLLPFHWLQGLPLLVELLPDRLSILADGAAAAMRWQADTGKPGGLVAGWFIGPGPNGHAVTGAYGPPYTSKAVRCLDGLWDGTIAASRCSIVQAALAYWHPAAVVAETSPGTPLAQFLTKLLGRPGIRDGQLLGWRTRARIASQARLSPTVNSSA